MKKSVVIAGLASTLIVSSLAFYSGGTSAEATQSSLISTEITPIQDKMINAIDNYQDVKGRLFSTQSN